MRTPVPEEFLWREIPTGTPRQIRFVHILLNAAMDVQGTKYTTFFKLF